MLRWSFLFMIVTLLAGLFGFTPIGGASYEPAKVVFFVFLTLFVLCLLFDKPSPRNIT